MGQYIHFKTSLTAAAISMLAAGPACAVPPTEGNTLVGPDLKSVGVTTVKINQSGTGNVTSSDGTADGGAFVVDQSGVGASTTTLTIQQVGTGNTLGLSSYTNTNTKVQVFQGADAETGNTGRLGTDATRAVTSNTATIEIGKDAADRASASDVFLTQQGNSNIAGLSLGKTAGVFTGVLNLLQVGDSNSATVTINEQTTLGQAFNIGQSGPSNSLSLTANGNQVTGITLDFGGLSFGQTTAQPTSADTVGDNNAASYRSDSTNFTTALAGINLLGTDQIYIKATDGQNNVQVDLAGAAGTGNKINVHLNRTAVNFAVYGLGGAVVNLGGNGRLSLQKNLVVFANGGTINMNGFNVENANSSLSTLDGGSINISGGSVGSGGMSVFQSGAAHSFSSASNGSESEIGLNVTQTGSIANSIDARSIESETSGTGRASFNLTQTSETGGSGHSMTLLSSAGSGGTSSFTVSQSGAGAKTLAMTSSTSSAAINATQTGAASQSATGINFAAASGSTFTLVQR